MKPKQAKAEILKVNQEKYDEIMICTSFFRIVMMAGVEPWSVAFQGVLSSWDAGSWTCCLPTNRKSSLRSISHALRFELCACYLALRCIQENHVNVNTKNLTFHDPWDQGCAETPRVKTWLHTLIMGAGRCGNMSCCYVFFSAVSFILDNKREGTKQRLQRQRHAVQRDCSLDLRLRSVVKWLPRYFSIAFEHHDFHRFSSILPGVFKDLKHRDLLHLLQGHSLEHRSFPRYSFCLDVGLNNFDTC